MSRLKQTFSPGWYSGTITELFFIAQSLFFLPATLAVYVANIAILIDPTRIAVGGELMNSADRILEALNYRLRFAVPFPPELVLARFEHDSALRGAVAIALDEAQIM